MKNNTIRSKWWSKTIRERNYFGFRYWWFNWAILLLGIALFTYFLYTYKKEVSACAQQTEINELIKNINAQLDSCCSCKIEDVPPPPPPPPPPAPKDSNEIFLPADYIIITYQFDASGGKDLDTRTKLISPTAGRDLGYCHLKPTEGLHWGGDNTDYGVESVYIDVKHFNENAVIEVLCKAWWFKRKDSGKMSLDIRAYKGGTMRLDADKHQFINDGGEQVGNVISFPHKINMFHNKCAGAEKIGVLKFDRATQLLSFAK